MAVTSLIKPVQDKKGALYNFQSSVEDINITIGSGENAWRFSKFALLRIPDIGVPNYLPTDNKIQFLAQGESPMIEGVNADQNVNMAQSFQNYALNLEALLISRPQYKRNEKLTVGERIFWKWLKEFGSIRFQDANSLEKNTNTLGTTPRFVEKPETSSTYNRIVKYIGDIDVVNSVKSKDNSYSEVYIHVPTNVGSTPHVLFQSVTDDNYFPNMTIANNPTDPLNIEYLCGRKYNESHPFGLSMKAFYDLDDSSVAVLVKDLFTDPYVTGNWFTQTIKNSYYTDNYNNTGVYNVAEDEFIMKQFGLSTIEYVRTKLDGISLDFDLANYKLASENQNIQVFSQFNDYVANKDFEFNAILIYYDVYDPNNLDSEGNPIDIRTNLYGVLFLDKIQQSGLEFKIPAIVKFKPDVLNKINGTSYSFKANLKLDTSIENVLVEKSINDFSTFSLELFTDVLTEFRQLQSKYTDKLLELEQLRQDVDGLKGLMIDTQDANEINIRLTNLETSLIENSAIFDNTNELVNLITNNSEKINSIITGDTNIEVSYNTDVLRSGPGIKIDKSISNRVKLTNTNQAYNVSDEQSINLLTANVIQLVNFSNYAYHKNGGNQTVLIRDIQVFIDDTNTSWKKGQSFKIVIDDEIILGAYNIKIYTDAKNITNSGEYGVLIKSFNDTDFQSDNTPIFEIICLNETSLTFKVDKIR